MQDQIKTSLHNLFKKMSGWIDTFIVNLPNIIIAILVFTAAYFLSRFLKKWSNKALKQVIHHQSIRGLISTLISIAVIGLGILLSLSVLQLDGTLKSLLAGAGIAGLAISLALQDTLSNTFSGIFIAIKKEINIGDYVETNGIAGTVVDIDLRNIKIKETDNNIVVLPNKQFLSAPFKNYGLTNRIRTTVECGVGYDTDLAFAKSKAIDAIKKIYPTKSNEEVEFYYTEFGDSSINFMIRFWVDAREKLTSLEVKSEAIMVLKTVFQNHHIDIPYPMRTILMNNE